MSDWAVGDLALCVNALPPPLFAGRESVLEEGRVYTVTGIYRAARPFRHRVTGVVSDLGLVLAGVRSASSSGSWAADRFRKIRPDEREACEPEFVTLLKRSKRPVSA